MRPKHINAINGQILKQGLCGVFDIRGTIINPFHFLVCNHVQIFSTTSQYGRPFWIIHNWGSLEIYIYNKDMM